MNPGQDLSYHAETFLLKMGNSSPYWELYGVSNPYMVIDDHGYDGNQINGIIDLTDNGPYSSMDRL